MSENSVSIPIPAIDDFEEKVIAACARQLMSSVSYDEDGDERRYRSELGRKIEAAMVETIKEQARGAAPDVARELLDSGVQRTNTWGDAEGPRVKLSTIVADEVRNTLRDGGSGRNGPGVIKQLITSEVERQLRDEFKEAIAEAKAPILELVRAEAAGAIERALRTSLAGLQ